LGPLRSGTERDLRAGLFPFPFSRFYITIFVPTFIGTASSF
jgi:hypothetical protein